MRAARQKSGCLPDGWDGAPRRVGARAIALEPDLIMFDEPFVGRDPDYHGRSGEADFRLNSALGVTCVVVSHDVPGGAQYCGSRPIMADKKCRSR